MYACTFIGHRDCPENIKPILYNEIEKLIVKNNVDTFYVGTHGKFDQIAYEILCDLEKTYSIKTYVVLAYLNRESKRKYYDMNKTVYPDILAKTPLRFAISKRNLFMISRSQYMVCYVDYTTSNAYAFAEKAVKRGVNVINIGSCGLNN